MPRKNLAEAGALCLSGDEGSDQPTANTGDDPPKKNGEKINFLLLSKKKKKKDGFLYTTLPPQKTLVLLKPGSILVGAFMINWTDSRQMSTFY